LFLEKHQEFMLPVQEYNEYASAILEKVEKKTIYAEALYRKRFRPKVTTSFHNFMNIQKDYHKIPKSIKANAAQHIKIMEDINKEKIVVKAQTQECYLNEKEMLAEINATEDKCQNVIQQTKAIEQHIEKCKASALEIENIENYLIPQTLDEINTAVEELNEVKLSLAEQCDKVSALEQDMRAFEAELERLQNEEIDYGEQMLAIEENLLILLAKNSLSEIEADDRLQEICNSEYFHEEKEQMIQIQVDNLEIRNDVNNYETLIRLLNAEIEETYQQMRENNYSEVCAKLKAEYKEAVKFDKELQDINAELKKSNDEEQARKQNVLDDLQQQLDDYNKESEEKIQKRENELENYNKYMEHIKNEIEKKRLSIEEHKKGEESKKKRKFGRIEESKIPVSVNTMTPMRVNADVKNTARDENKTPVHIETKIKVRIEAKTPAKFFQNWMIKLLLKKKVMFHKTSMLKN
jgi:hypothetical protein